MITGRQALGSIDQTINQARDQIAALQTQITEATERLIEQQQEQAEDYRHLARIRLSKLAGLEVVENLDSAERQVIELLQKRTIARTNLNGEIQANEDVLASVAQRREQQAARLDAAIAIVDQAEAKTQQKLDTDPDYRQQREAAEAAGRRAAHAAEKAQGSEEEQEKKGEAYRNDPLFMYLWGRSFGLPAYTAGGLSRWLDGRVARLIGYADARANYARLNEIPIRLREHATQLKTAADAEFVKLRERDEIARAADGIPTLEDRVVEEQRLLDDIDLQVNELEAHHRSLSAERSRYAAGDDVQMRDIVEYLANEFRRDDLVSLRHDAIRTPYPEDDVVLSRMLQREQEQAQGESSVEGLKGALEQHQQRLLELESVRADFKRNRFDRAGSVFASNTVVAMLLSEFLSGMLDQRMLWKVLREQQHYRPQRSDPGFGSGGFGRGTVWKGGLGDLGDIIGGIGRGGFGGRGGGGPGGGGIGGGGGFRTGGGF